MNRLERMSAQLGPCAAEGYAMWTQPSPRVALLTLNRPKVLNALNQAHMAAISRCLTEIQADTTIGCIVLTGAGSAFAAGADLKEMAQQKLSDAVQVDFIQNLDSVANCKIPIIAAINGVALGGGCEIAMMCDILIASSKAKFGQPEIAVGAIPGAGGTQRLIRAVGKSKAMEMILTGRMISAEEALAFGLVSQVVAPLDLLPTALKLASNVAEKSRPLSMLAKRCVLTAENTGLHHGVQFERSVFHSVFGLKDQKEGMTAFAEKRKPNWSHS